MPNSFNETPRDTITGWEPGSAYGAPDNRAQFYGVGALDLENFKYIWFRQIVQPEESSSTSSPNYHAMNPIIHNDGVLVGVLCGTAYGFSLDVRYPAGGTHIYFYNINKVNGEIIPYVTESTETNYYRINNRNVGIRYWNNNDIMMDENGTLWWLEWPVSTIIVSALNPTNPTQVWALQIAEEE